MTKSTIPTVDPIVAQLDALARESPDLKPIAALYAVILPLLRDANLRVEPVTLSSERAGAKLEAGLPLLRDENLAFDIHDARILMIGLARAVEELPADAVAPRPRFRFFHPARGSAPLEEVARADAARRSTAAEQIRRALEQNLLDVGALLTPCIIDDHALINARAEELQLDPELLQTLAYDTVKPAWRAWAKQLAPLAVANGWARGFCFVCGARAALGELQDNGQVKHLRCVRCGADWQFRRLECAFCGNDDPRTLTYLFASGQQEHRQIEVCDRCGGYLKLIAAFSPTPVEMLAVQDLATLHLDYIAEEHGLSYPKTQCAL